MKSKNVLIAMIAIMLIMLAGFMNFRQPNNLPTVAIANYGPHSSLESSIIGIKEELARQGYIENRTIHYEIADVGFDASLIPQMIATLKNRSPKVMVVMATPVAQYAKGAIKDISLVYNVITDPVGSGLLKESNAADANMTGSSDKQDLNILLKFSQQLIPKAKRVGLLYATSESNDLVLVKMMEQAAKELNMKVLPIAIDQARDVPQRMQQFKDRVDFIYVGASGPIQPTLPAIAAEANKMHIPVLNVNEEAIKEGLVLASFGVSYKQVGINAGKQVAKLLQGIELVTLHPIYPTFSDHHGYVNVKKAKELGLAIPQNLSNVEIVE